MRLFPVIHYLTDAQAMQNARIAADLGCAGVFVIDMHRARPKEALQCALDIAKQLPQLAVGANHLGFTGFAGLERNVKAGLGMTWTDECVTHTQHVQPNDPGLERLVKTLKAEPSHQFFAGVAFKYQPDELNPGLAAKRVLELGGVPTTSGPATGRSAALDKLREIRQAIGPDARLAVASGVTPENAAQFKGLVSDVLVATSVTSTDGANTLIREKLEALVQAVQT